MTYWLAQLHQLDQLDAYQLLSQISETPLANVVDTNFSCVTKIDKRLLPSSPVFGGISTTSASGPPPLAPSRTELGDEAGSPEPSSPDHCHDASGRHESPRWETQVSIRPRSRRRVRASAHHGVAQWSCSLPRRSKWIKPLSPLKMPSTFGSCSKLHKRPSPRDLLCRRQPPSPGGPRKRATDADPPHPQLAASATVVNGALISRFTGSVTPLRRSRRHDRGCRAAVRTSSPHPPPRTRAAGESSRRCQGGRTRNPPNDQ